MNHKRKLDNTHAFCNEQCSLYPTSPAQRCGVTHYLHAGNIRTPAPCDTPSVPAAHFSAPQKCATVWTAAGQRRKCEADGRSGEK